MTDPQFCTLIEILEYRAVHNRDDTAITFDGESTTYGSLMDGVDRFAAALQGLGITPGDRVVIVIPNSAQFFSAFYGVQRAGGIAVPLFPGSSVERVFSIVDSCSAAAVVVFDDTTTDQLSAYRKSASERQLHVLTVAETLRAETGINFPDIDPQAIAFLQITSGSTGNPKGVQLTHENLVTNMVQMIDVLEIISQDVFISWLPVYHDMGLIIMTMMPFFAGAVAHLLPTNLKDVRPWLHAIQCHQGTFTAAPDFAYRLILRHVNPEDYDLSSLRVAMNAAEPVRASTILNFESAFNLRGVMIPAYGLAEATVGVSFSPLNSGPRVDERGFVSVGLPLPEVSVKIVRDGETLPAGEIGEIAFFGPSNSCGYYSNPVETENLKMDDGYNLSGDLGYLDEEGHLYIVGRKKIIIKRAGETISPQELEEIVDANPAVRYSAAVGVDKGGLLGEDVYIFAEIRDGETKTENELIELTFSIVNAFHDRMGFRPGRVYLLKPRAIPLTHNGKLKHGQLKEEYLDGRLRESNKILYPEY